MLYARLLQMSDARLTDEALIERSLTSPAAPLRAAAARSIGQLRASAMSNRLRPLLLDADSAVAANAAFALGLLRDSGSVSALDSAVRTGQAVAREAAWALGEIGEPARQVIEARLSDPSPKTVRGELLLAAAKLRPVPVSGVARWLGDSDEEVVWRAAYAIARPLASAGARALLALTLHPSAAVRAQVARGLAKGTTGDSLAGPAIVHLAVLAADRDPHVRINALRAYATHGDSARLALIAAIRDPDANVRIAAARLLGDVMNRDLVRWSWLWDADTTFAYREALLGSAVRAGVWLPAMRTWADSSAWRNRAAVAYALASAGSGRSRELTLSLARDQDARVRAAAYALVGRALDSVELHPWSREALRHALADPDPLVRATVLNALRSRATAADFPLFLDSYRRARSDPAPDARLAAVRALAAAWRSDSAAVPPELASEVAALEAPADPLVRAAAGELSLLVTWKGVVGERRSLSWYEHLVRTLILQPDTAPPLLARIETERGAIVVELFAIDAPLTVHNFITLARTGFYKQTRFHRVVPNFVAQDGDPREDGSGGPGYVIRDELNSRRYGRGVLGMAHSGPDTGGSQYFLTLSPQPHLEGHYTAFGRVVDGMDVLDAIAQGDRIEQVLVP